MSEKKLQSKIVMDFSQKRPHENGLLWSTRNITLSEKDGMTQRAMGMVPGVADLIYFKNGILLCIEIKEPGSRHSSAHIERQLSWGKKITAQGGRYGIVTSVDSFWCLLENVTNCEVYTIEKIESLLNTNKKTITF
jgi:hypothetical protein